MGGRRRTPYVRWERSLVGGTELVGALQQELLNLGVEPINLKPPETATVSIAPAPHFKNAASQGIIIDHAMLAQRFLHATHRTPLRPVKAASEGVGFIKGREDIGGQRVVMHFNSHIIQDECTAINSLLHRPPYRGIFHISIANVATQTENEQHEITRCLSSLVTETTFQFDPVLQKSVDAIGATTIRGFRSLEREYYIQRVKQFFVSGFGSDFPHQHTDDAPHTFAAPAKAS